MTNSYKKVPITGNTKASSEKEDKKINHGKFRARERDMINKSEYDDCPSSMRSVMSVWSYSKDGKHYVSKNKQEKYKRK